MSAYREVQLFCDDLACPAKFEPDPGLGFGFVSSVTLMRRLAKKAGWTYVRHPTARFLDKDYCPDHEPEESQ